MGWGRVGEVSVDGDSLNIVSVVYFFESLGVGWSGRLKGSSDSARNSIRLLVNKLGDCV